MADGIYPNPGMIKELKFTKVDSRDKDGKVADEQLFIMSARSNSMHDIAVIMRLIYGVES